MTKTIFSDFDAVTAKAWKQKIQMDLKGADYNTTLLSNTLEGITISPFYHQDTYKSLEIPQTNKDSKICQPLFINDTSKVNGIAKEALSKGADAIRFIANAPFDFKILFQGFPKDKTYLFFCDFLDTSFFNDFIIFSQNYNVRISIDPINHFVKEGHWMSSEQDVMTYFNQHQNLYIGVNTSLYQNSGANIVQQIGYSLAHANEYLNADLKNHFIFTFAIGSNYFFEISKIRAFKYLITSLLNDYNAKNTFEIVLEPTLRNKTLYDYNVNMLRTSTESMASTLSGADFISNVSYDAIYHRSNEFGSRIARNQLLILKEESYFDKKHDISKGSYYIEQITYELARKALDLFKNIEKNGGFLKQIHEGTIQRKIEESAQQEQALFDSGLLILLGTNKYPNKKDVMADNLELYPFIKTKQRKTIIKPIIPRRLSEKMEQERLKKE